MSNLAKNCSNRLTFLSYFFAETVTLLPGITAAEITVNL